MESVMPGQCCRVIYSPQMMTCFFLESTVLTMRQNSHGQITIIVIVICQKNIAEYQSSTNHPTNQLTNQFNTLLEKPYTVIVTVHLIYKMSLGMCILNKAQQKE